MPETVNENHSEEVLLFLFVTLLFGVVITWTLSRYPIGLPYSVIIFTLGIIVSFWANRSGLDDYGNSLRQWASISPKLLLFTFLPALLFGDAMELNIRHFQRTIFSALMLAGPGSVLGTFLLAACLRVMTPYDWSWTLCYTIGAILCATDPVSVIALLKDSGASHSLKILITLEALLNDGAALVLFNLFFNSLLIEKDEATFATPGLIAWYFFRILIISPLVGFAFGLGTCLAMSYANKRLKSEDVLVQVVLTISSAYLSFFVAEHFLSISGVLSCIFCGIANAWLGPAIILEHETMTNIWGTINWLSNTLIFTLAGLLIGNINFNVSWIDVFMIIVVYVLTQIIRIIMIIIFYPILARFGYGVSVDEAIFIAWSGVRGAIGITLALVLVRSSSTENPILSISEEEGHRIFLIIGGVAALTLLVNGTLAKSVLHSLGLVKRTSEEMKILQHYARKRLQLTVQEAIRNLDTTSIYYEEDFESRVYEMMQSQPAMMAMLEAPVDPSSPGRPRPVLRSRPSIYVYNNEFNRDSPSKRNMEGNRDSTSYNNCCESNNSSSFSPMWNSVEKDGIDSKEAKQEAAKLLSNWNNYNSCNSFITSPLWTGWTNESAREASLELIPVDQNSLYDCPVISSTGRNGFMSLSMTSEKEDVKEEMPFPSLNTPRSLSLSLSIHAPSVTIRTEINESLLTRLRITFLDVVRSAYWKQIAEGSLPRNSFVAVTLLYSLDVGIEFAGHPGHQDWIVLKPTLSNRSFHVIKQLLDPLDAVIDGLKYLWISQPESDTGRRSSLAVTVVDYLKRLRDEYVVSLLTNFIAAHRYAQLKAPKYLGETEFADTPEEAIIVRESCESVEAAMAMLSSIGKEVIQHHALKQIANKIVHIQEDMVLHFKDEGILYPVDAELLVAEIELQRQQFINLKYHRVAPSPAPV